MLHLLFFRGHGLVPVLVRLFCWHWWHGQRWRDVPAHVAIWDRDNKTEYEAIVTGIRSGQLDGLNKLSGLVEMIPVSVPHPDAARAWLDEQVGRPYGFLAATATGLGILSPPALDRLWRTLWEHLSGGRSGRTAPLDCSLLAQMALRAGGQNILGRDDGLPVSPNDLFLSLLSLKGLKTS